MAVIRGISIQLPDNTQHLSITVIDAGATNFVNEFGIITGTAEYLITDTGEYITYA